MPRSGVKCICWPPHQFSASLRPPYGSISCSEQNLFFDGLCPETQLLGGLLVPGLLITPLQMDQLQSGTQTGNRTCTLAQHVP